MARRSPNIVLVICHDLGQYCRCYGADAPTPHIDELAARGVRFSNYHCSAAQCSPSRGSIMTGRMPHTNGLAGLAHLGFRYNPGERTLAMHLGEAGYETVLFGMQHETAADPATLGYSAVYGEPGRARDVMAKAAASLLARDRGAAHPFLYCVGTFETHRPYHQAGYHHGDPVQVSVPPWLPDRPGIREDIAGLNGLVRELDGAVGLLTRALEESGLAEETLVVFTTDHGLAMPRAKGTCFDPGVKTALIASQPGTVPCGRVDDSLLANCDLLPTLLELAGVEPQSDLDGRSFAGLLTGGSHEPRQDVLLEMTWHDLYNPMRAVKTANRKYIRSFAQLPLVYLPKDIWQAPSGREVWPEYYAGVRPEEELYDLDADPMERRSVAGDPAYTEDLVRLRQRVLSEMDRTGDRLLQGPWPAPSRYIEAATGWSRSPSDREWFERATSGDLPHLMPRVLG